MLLVEPSSAPTVARRCWKARSLAPNAGQRLPAILIVKIAILAALAVALYLLPVEGTPLLAQENTEIFGQVVNGTEGAALPDDLNMLMLITGPDGALSGTGQTTPDPQGRFVFEDVQVKDGDTYTISVDHLGVFYGASLDSSSLSEDLQVTIFETTRDASIIQLERQVMVIVAVDKSEQLSVIEFVRINNPTDRTLMPDLTNLEQISFLRFALPPDPAALTVQSDLPGGDIVSIGTGFALTSPVTPGGHSIDFSYTFPFNDETLSYRQSLPQGAEIFQVLVPATLTDINLPSLEGIDPVTIQGISYRAYEARDIPPGLGLQLEIAGLPLPGVWTRFSNSVTGGKFWQVAIPTALGSTLAAMLLWGLLKGYESVPEPVGSLARMTLTPSERAALVRAVADLDQRYREGSLPDLDHRIQRRELMARLLVSAEEAGTVRDSLQ